MKLTDKYWMSDWAYNQCINGNDSEYMRTLITDSWDCYLYCMNIEDM